jgi:hypothetical protein
VLWIDLIIGVVAISWAVYLMYLGIPIVMNIPQERGFLFSSAILAIVAGYSRQHHGRFDPAALEHPVYNYKVVGSSPS